MVYKVFISTTNDERSADYVKAVRMALWQLNEFPVSPVTMDDLVVGDDPLRIIRQTIDETNIFIGVFGTTYGQNAKQVSELIEMEYNYAVERGIMTVIFTPKDHSGGDERLQAFIQRVKERQVVHTFTTLDDLKAQVIVAVTNYRQHMREQQRPTPPRSAIAPELGREIVDTSFETDVRRALNIVEEDIETIVRRAIAVQEARSVLDPGQKAGAGHEITVNPIFGAPNNGSQFQSDIFMIMPFRAQYDSIYQNVVRPVVADLNLTIKRGDEFSSVSGQIISEVWAAINACRLVIVETSEENANV